MTPVACGAAGCRESEDLVAVRSGLGRRVLCPACRKEFLGVSS